MLLRMPVPEQLQPACEYAIPNGTKRASVGSQKLALPVPNPSRVAVIGDTGCRLKGDRVQACNDPQEWPFGQIAGAVAAAKPQLVVHVGDYLYRESACPPDQQKSCGGSPVGDNWEAWNADFFRPAGPLLSAAPWAFTRGNHESCARSWRGWFYYLDPRPYNETCSEYSDPYLAELGTLRLLMTDTSSAKDGATADAKQIAKYAEQWKQYADTQAWVVEHHPLWGLKRDNNDKSDAPLTSVMNQAYKESGLKRIGLILAGHTHLFEILSFSDGRPPQIVAGDGGTSLAEKISDNPKGETVFGATVSAGTARQQFGYTMLERKRSNWRLKLHGLGGRTLADCSIMGSAVHCKTGA